MRLYACIYKIYILSKVTCISYNKRKNLRQAGDIMIQIQSNNGISKTEHPFNKNTLLVTFIISLHFLWSGSSYLSWLYNVIDIIDVNNLPKTALCNVDILSEVVAYLFQVLGIVLLSIAIKKTNLPFEKSKFVFIIASIIHMIIAVPALLTNSFYIALIAGFLFNLLIGIETGYYLIMITELIPANRKAFTFGAAYSIGSIGSWILSLIGNNNFLKSNYIIPIYVLILAVTMTLVVFINAHSQTENNSASETNNNSVIVITALAIFLLCTVKGIGFYFPMADITSGNVSLELSRAFYAIGLLLAGIIGDYKRQYGAIACIIALIFPFVLLCLTFSPTYSYYLWILGYVFTGFYAVYRVTVFSDISSSYKFGLYLAPFGLMFGRLGDAIGAFIGISLTNRTFTLVLIAGVIFIAAIITSFFAYIKLYVAIPINNIQEENKMTPEEKMASFAIYHDLSAREKEVLPLILEGHSNSEISGLLYVSENTVKFHVRNILKKTGCQNRQELSKNYYNYQP